MLKKVMFALMAVIAGSRFFALAFILSTDKNRFPVPIYISTGIIALLGIGLVCKRIISTVHTKELIFFYMATSVSVLFNLLFIKMFSRMEVSLFDFLMIGTLMDIVVAVTLTVMTLKERRYVRLAVATAKS